MKKKVKFQIFSNYLLTFPDWHKILLINIWILRTGKLKTPFIWRCWLSSFYAVLKWNQSWKLSGWCERMFKDPTFKLVSLNFSLVMKQWSCTDVWGFDCLVVLSSSLSLLPLLPHVISLGLTQAPEQQRPLHAGGHRSLQEPEASKKNVGHVSTRPPCSSLSEHQPPSPPLLKAKGSSQGSTVFLWPLTLSGVQIMRTHWRTSGTSFLEVPVC